MKKISWFSRLSNQQPSLAMIPRIAGGIGVATLMTGIALAQNPTTAAPLPAPETHTVVPDGYAIHQGVDLGGHIDSISGSGAMYDTMVNLHSGPRVLGETFEMRALPGTKHTLLDSLTAISNGFGGDPNNFAKLDFYKGRVYEFSGIFRRDRQYFDYDLLGNPNIPGGQSIPIAGSTTPLAWPQVRQSPVMFNTVRRMTDTSLTLFPLSKVTFRAGYSQNVFEGPTLSPGGSSNFFAESIGAYDALLEQYQRNSTDDFTGAVDWKPWRKTKLTFEEQIDHYKADSYFTLAPSSFIAQEADGTPVALGNWDSLTPYGSSACAASSMGGNPLLSAPTAGGRPIINAACSVATSYIRSQPTRILYPTETFRFQSSSIKNIAMNGEVRYTQANMHLPNYYEQFRGLDVSTTSPAGGIRSIMFAGNALAKREVVAADYGIVWQATRTVTLSDQFDFSNVHQPGTANISAGTTLETPATAGNETINYSGTLTAGPSVTVEGSPNGAPLPDYFGQRFVTNNLTGSWDATPRATLSLTYRYQTHRIVQGAATGASSSVIDINENGGIFNVALRPTNHWDVNGTVEMLYDDNVFTPVGPRQTKHYRVHTIYRPRPWATISGAFNDLERHDNTNNTGTAPIDGLIDHVDHSRVVSLGAVLAPNEHYGLDLNYAYSDVYAATNICYLNGSPTSGTSTSLPGAVTSATATLCPGVFTRGSTTILSDWGPSRDFMDAPTQYGSASLIFSPVKSIHSNVGYRISSVNGSRFFNDARDVNGSLVSTYQSPYVNFAWTVHSGWVWKAEYNYYGYGEGGRSGSPYCSTATTVAGEATIVPCNSTTLTGPTGLTESPSGLTAPRNFHANNVTLSMHYEF
jgi:hypothetical protein